MLGFGALGELAFGQPDSAPPTDFFLTAETGVFTLTGQDADLLADRHVTAEAGTFSLTGQDADLLATRRITAETGEFTLTGQAAGLLAGRVLFASFLTARSRDLDFLRAQ